ncbi:hypothetical protein LCGC14_1164930 [marine sediment metagenome]|uniref:Uncharacterized protein n=1 Tax=marine sediment metagenome TaxID=412755 RepID=A0A0F9P9R0_9ZZZZ
MKRPVWRYGVAHSPWQYILCLFGRHDWRITVIGNVLWNQGAGLPPGRVWTETYACKRCYHNEWHTFPERAEI